MSNTNFTLCIVGEAFVARGGVLEGASIRSFTKLKMESHQPWKEKWGEGYRFEPQATSFYTKIFAQ